MPSSKLNQDSAKAVAVDDIADETEESKRDDDYEIEDFYEDDASPQKPLNADLQGTDLELDYSQTHLEDFLKSQTNASLLKGSQLQTGQLLNSFLSTYNKMKGTQQPTNRQTMNDIEENSEQESF